MNFFFSANRNMQLTNAMNCEHFAASSVTLRNDLGNWTNLLQQASSICFFSAILTCGIFKNFLHFTHKEKKIFPQWGDIFVCIVRLGNYLTDVDQIWFRNFKLNFFETSATSVSIDKICKILLGNIQFNSYICF